MSGLRCKRNSDLNCSAVLCRRRINFVSARFLFLLLLFWMFQFTMADRDGQRQTLLPRMNTAYASEPQIGARVTNREIRIGDKIRYEIELNTDKEFTAEINEWSGKFEGFAVKDFGTEHKFGLFSKKYIWWFILDTYLSGQYQIQGMSVRYKKSEQNNWTGLDVPEVEVNVLSAMGGEDMTDIIDIHGVRSLNHIPRVVWVFLILTLILTVGAGIYFFFFRPRASQVIEEKILPHVKALESLSLLYEKKLPDRGEIKEYFFELSLIARIYIEERFELRAAEMTTEEFWVYVRDCMEIGTQHRSMLREFFEFADMVKFAKYVSTPVEIEKSFDSVKSFVEETALKEAKDDREDL